MAASWVRRLSQLLVLGAAIWTMPVVASAAGTSPPTDSCIASRGAFELTRQTSGALLRAATQPFKGGSLTHAGRALTKHPELLGFTKANLRQTLRSDAAINAAAEGALGGILRSGSAVRTTAGRFGEIIDVTAPSGFGARFSAAGKFIGFLSP